MVMTKPVNAAPPISRLAPIQPAAQALLAKGVPAQSSESAVPAFLLEVRALANLGPPVDLEKVSELHQKIASGTYRIDPDQLAAAIMAYHEVTLS